jgi:two-component system sensor histidine kinase RegB
MVLAREQQLHALDGLAAAAAHELGTPLSTIAVVAKELNRDAAQGSQFAEDLALLQSQAVRCREILKKLTRGPTEPDPLHARMSITQLIEEAAGPYRGFGAALVMTASPDSGCEGAALPEPVGERRPGVLYGLGNLVENAVDFAHERVEIAAKWSARHVVIEIADDGPGVPADVMDALGEPYITTRPARSRGQIKDGEPSGLGLGFFIAKTLLARSGATVTLDNRQWPDRGAIVKISWPREVFERKQATMPAMPHERVGLQQADADGGVH